MKDLADRPNKPMKKIRELTVDETFQLFLLIKNADVRIAKNGKKFIAFTFQDTSGTIDGKFWDASDEEIARFEPGKVVLLDGWIGVSYDNYAAVRKSDRQRIP